MTNNEITIQPTKGFTTPPKGMEFTARIRTTDGGGISGKSNYGSTEDEAKANLLARLEKEGYQFEDANGDPVTQWVNADGFLQDTPYEPTFKAFAATVTAGEAAVTAIVVVMFAVAVFI